MFERVVEWKKVVAIIGDLTMGTSTLSLRQFAKSDTRDETDLHAVFGWDYHRVQRHGDNTPGRPALATNAHLTDTLLTLEGGSEGCYSYEVDGATSFEEDAKRLVEAFSAISVVTIKLSVGVVQLGWILVKLESNPDIVHWKMRYHERNVRPAATTTA